MANFVKTGAHRGIFCLEMPWNASSENIDETAPKTVLPGLQLITRYHGLIQLNYKTCATSAELRYHLEDFATMKKNAREWYGCLYIASHGSRGSIHLPGDKESLTIGQLAKMIGKLFKGAIVYFGSCSVLDCNDSELENFIDETEVDVIVGYKYDIDWVDSTILDILFLNRFLDDNRPKSKVVFWKKFEADYKEFIKKYGMVFYG